MLKTYTSQGILGSFVVPMGQSPGWVGQLEPGQQVTHVNGSGFGLVVSVDDTNVVVLWSVEPTTAFDNVAFWAHVWARVDNQRPGWSVGDPQVALEKPAHG